MKKGVLRGVILEIIGYGTGIGTLLALIVTYIFAGFNDYKVTIHTNNYGEHYIEILMFIIGIVGLAYSAWKRLTLPKA